MDIQFNISFVEKKMELNYCFNSLKKTISALLKDGR